MAREVKTFTWCDMHLAREEAEFTEGTEVTIAVDSLKPRVLALCEPCAKELLVPLREALLEHGQTSDSPAPPRTRTDRLPRSLSGMRVTDPFPEPLPCEWPNCRSRRTYATPKSLHQHAYTSHQVTGAEYRAATDPSGVDQTTLPVDAEVDLAEYTCPECGIVYDPRTLTHPKQALGAHKFKKHGIKGKARA